MSNNAPDYNDNLAFPPTITWTELVEWAKWVKDVEVYAHKGRIVASNLEFLETGDVYLGLRVYDIDMEPVDIRVAENRTFEQMKNIMENLR